jgi:beta-lactamase class D
MAGFAPRASAQQGPPRVEMQPEFGDAFAEADAAGTFAMLDVAGNRIVVSDRERAEKGFLPASTFKIPNSLIALDTGVVADADATMFPWDKVVRDFDAWNRDHTLRSAFTASAVPVYQDIAGAIDTFWLEGKLRTSAMQQIAFLHKLHDGKLPVSARSQEVVRDMMYIEQTEWGTLRGKTGAVGIAAAPGSKATMGWLVGWLERAGKPPFVFAMNIDVRGQKQLALRLPIVKALLKRSI